ncbi:Methyl-CpG-binding domain protein 4 [Hypsizygus marmoreus]|uniref:Methyl-CpG-binding domain protein 4 n=1 Tax=Hypsizygus marmoreus TaxID=39966 RepID=A0A369K4J1_HYPMA|nr:Methyl-CpG-binding domain protein 4 [Hypsizygus marmoreus]
MTPIISSPYFTSKVAAYSQLPSSSDHHSQCEPDPNDVLTDDPLFCYYFRAFLRLYSQLVLLKPVMIQECVADDPWKLLIAVTLLNKTAGKLAIPIFWKILATWATPWALSQANQRELAATIRPLGTQNIRSKRLIALSRAYLRDPPKLPDLRPSKARSSSSPYIFQSRRYPPTHISHLPGTGPYALDSYRIFCTVHDEQSKEEWKAVMPTDKELIRYLKWKWALLERKEWVPGLGVVRPVTLAYLKTLISDLRQEKRYKADG